MQAFSVREALRQAVGAFGPPGYEVELGCPSTPEAVYWAIEAARPAAGRPGATGADRGRAAGGGLSVDWLERRSAAPARRAGPACWSPWSRCAATPRGTPGAKMVVGADQLWGSVGGGNLEASAVRPGPGDDRRRARPARRSRSRRSASTRRDRARPAVLRRRGPAAAGAAAGPAGGRGLRRRARRLRAGPHPVPAAGPAAAGRLAGRAAGPAPAGRRHRRPRPTSACTTRCWASRCWSGCRAGRTC